MIVSAQQVARAILDGTGAAAWEPALPVSVIAAGAGTGALSAGRRPAAARLADGR